MRTLAASSEPYTRLGIARAHVATPATRLHSDCAHTRRLRGRPVRPPRFRSARAHCSPRPERAGTLPARRNSVQGPTQSPPQTQRVAQGYADLAWSQPTCLVQRRRPTSTSGIVGPCVGHPPKRTDHRRRPVPLVIRHPATPTAPLGHRCPLLCVQELPQRRPDRSQGLPQPQLNRRQGHPFASAPGHRLSQRRHYHSRQLLNRLRLILDRDPPLGCFGCPTPSYRRITSLHHTLPLD
jgi:hypothetical protein